MTDERNEGLRHDFEPLLKSALPRRRWLQLAGALGAAALAPACTRSASATMTGTDAQGSTCVQHTEETAGPFPSDGSNDGVDGALSNALGDSGAVRQDITRSFGRSTAVAPGTPLEMTLRLVDVNDRCAPLVGHALYVWHCTADGSYSLYTAGVENENFLRGVHVSDANGDVTFRTIVPGCYAGRFPHIHVEVFPSLEATSDHRQTMLISQMAIPAKACSEVYAADEAYATSRDSFAQMTLANDGIFRNNTEQELTAMTLAVSGNATRGYSGGIEIGVPG